MGKFDKWFSIDISLPFFLELPTKEPQVIRITFRGLGIENSFLVSALNHFNIKKDLAKDSNEDKQQTAGPSHV